MSSIQKLKSGRGNKVPRLVADGTEVIWSEDVHAAFMEALVIYPPMGRQRFKLFHFAAMNDMHTRSAYSRLCKTYSRCQLIQSHIHNKTGRLRTRKQISSHMQRLKKVHKENPQMLSLLRHVLPSCSDQKSCDSDSISSAKVSTDHLPDVSLSEERNLENNVRSDIHSPLISVLSQGSLNGEITLSSTFVPPIDSFEMYKSTIIQQGYGFSELGQQQSAAPRSLNLPHVPLSAIHAQHPYNVHPHDNHPFYSQNYNYIAPRDYSHLNCDTKPHSIFPLRLDNGDSMSLSLSLSVNSCLTTNQQELSTQWRFLKTDTQLHHDPLLFSHLVSANASACPLYLRRKLSFQDMSASQIARSSYDPPLQTDKSVMSANSASSPAGDVSASSLVIKAPSPSYTTTTSIGIIEKAAATQDFGTSYH